MRKFKFELWKLRVAVSDYSLIPLGLKSLSINDANILYFLIVSPFFELFFLVEVSLDFA